MTSIPQSYKNPDPSDQPPQTQQALERFESIRLTWELDRANQLSDDAYTGELQKLHGNIANTAPPRLTRVDKDLLDWSPESPDGGWSDFWPALGETVAGASYLEQKAKPAENVESSVQSAWRDDPTKTCGEAGIGRFALTGIDKSGKHQVAKVLVCNREWCKRCGINSEQGFTGSIAHQRRISRWLKKAVQMESVGYWVLTAHPELRSHFRDPEFLSYIARKSTQMFKSFGYGRGLRRWHWFGEEENAQPGEAPVYHPHLNVIVDGGFIEPERLDEMRDAWGRLIRRAIKKIHKIDLGETPETEVHYSYGETPGQKYHRVRYVQRSTFKNLQWDEYMARQLLGFRNNQTWGKWDGEALWQPEPQDSAPTEGAQKLQGNNCPSCDIESEIEWSPTIIAAGLLNSEHWRDYGAGYYARDIE